MKKALALLLCVILLIITASCGSNETPNNTAETESGAADSTILTPESDTEAPAQSKTEFAVGETWTVDGQWELTVTGVTETAERNEYEEKEPAAVYIVNFTWKNTGYTDASGLMNGLFLVLDDSIVDSQGLMGYPYPGEITDYPQETPVGASCNGQVCIGVDNAGLPIKINVTQYDGNGVEQTATFIVE